VEIAPIEQEDGNVKGIHLLLLAAAGLFAEPAMPSIERTAMARVLQ
jgi:hypothetical protein